MPHILVKMIAGRTQEQKQALATALTQALASTLKCGDESVSVAIEDVSKDDWTNAVYVPDIQNRAELIYRSLVTIPSAEEAGEALNRSVERYWRTEVGLSSYREMSKRGRATIFLAEYTLQRVWLRLSTEEHEMEKRKLGRGGFGRIVSLSVV